LSDKNPGNILVKFNRRKFDDDMLFDIPRLYTSASSYAIQPLRLHPILLISILLYCYEQLSGWILKVEQMMMV
jgi:hypothetical protein